MSAKTMQKTKIEEDEMVPVPNDVLFRYLAATLAFASQLAHLWALQQDFLFRPLGGGLMFLAAVCQGILAVGLVFGPGRWMVRFGLALNATLALVWAVTRFAGSPGLLGFDRLPVEPLNLVVALAEVALVVLLCVISNRERREAG